MSPNAARARRLSEPARRRSRNSPPSRQALEKARADADYLRHAHAELIELAAKPGEERRYAEQRATMMQAEKVSVELRDAADALAGEGPPLCSAVLGPAAARAPAERRRRICSVRLQCVRCGAFAAFDRRGQAIEQALRDADYDPGELERVEERLFALRAASRKYGVAVDALADPGRANRRRSRGTRCRRSTAREVSARRRRRRLADL